MLCEKEVFDTVASEPTVFRLLKFLVSIFHPLVELGEFFSVVAVPAGLPS